MALGQPSSVHRTQRGAQTGLAPVQSQTRGVPCRVWRGLHQCGTPSQCRGLRPSSCKVSENPTTYSIKNAKQSVHRTRPRHTHSGHAIENRGEGLFFKTPVDRAIQVLGAIKVDDAAIIGPAMAGGMGKRGCLVGQAKSKFRGD